MSFFRSRIISTIIRMTHVRLETIDGLVSGFFLHSLPNRLVGGAFLFAACCHHQRLMKSHFMLVAFMTQFRRFRFSFNVCPLRCNWLFFFFFRIVNCELHLRALNSQSTNYWFRSVNVSQTFGIVAIHLFHFSVFLRRIHLYLSQSEIHDFDKAQLSGWLCISQLWLVVFVCFRVCVSVPIGYFVYDKFDCFIHSFTCFTNRFHFISFCFNAHIGSMRPKTWTLFRVRIE